MKMKENETNMELLTKKSSEKNKLKMEKIL